MLSLNFFQFKIFYNQFILFSSKLDKTKIIFLILYNIYNVFVSKKIFKKSIIRSPHVDKKSQETFMQEKMKFSFFLNMYSFKQLMFKTQLIKYWFSTYIYKESKVLTYYIFYKKNVFK